MIINKPLKSGSNPDLIEEIITKAVTYLAHDPELMSRFLDLTGVKPEEIRSLINQQTFQAAIFEYYLSDESLLLAFCANYALDPASVQSSCETLSMKISD